MQDNVTLKKNHISPLYYSSFRCISTELIKFFIWTCLRCSDMSYKEHLVNTKHSVQVELLDVNTVKVQVSYKN